MDVNRTSREQPSTSSPPLGPAKPAEVKRASQSRISLTLPNVGTIAKTMEVSRRVFKLIEDFTQRSTELTEIARGKAKRIFASADPDKVVIAPTEKGKMKEINEEVRISNDIKLRLTNTPHEDGLPFLNVHFENYEPSKELNLLQMRRADCDLEAAVVQDLNIGDRLKICEQIVTGLSALHSIGYVHGDLKPENVLFFSKGHEIHVEVSDFGKTATVGATDIQTHTGNPRFAAPEGVLSQKAEVYSAGLLLIRVLEEAILSSKEETKPVRSADLPIEMDIDDRDRVSIEMLPSAGGPEIDHTARMSIDTAPSAADPKPKEVFRTISNKPLPASDFELPSDRTMIVATLKTASPSKAHAKRRGIEQKLIEEGLRRENTDKMQDFLARVDAGKARMGMSTNQSKSQDVVHDYIRNLIGELHSRYPEINARQLERTLCDMTVDDPSLRPTMDEALKSFKAARENTSITGREEI